MILLALEEFAARRRGTQRDYEERLRPAVEHAVDLTENTHGWQELLNLVADIYTSAVFEESGQRGIILPGNIRQDLYQTLRKTTAPRTSTTVDRITVWLATAVLSLATMKASEVDDAELFVEWVTMHDNDVRETHRDADGQVRPLGEKFDVGGAQMRYPGDPRVDPALWMNCRCTLRPVLADEALVAASLAERPGLGGYPINNCADLKNAIQAIGRARPQDRAKTIAHIRTQKKNLGCPEVTLPESWATASEDAVKQKSAVVVALPHPDDPVHQIGDEQKHATVAFLGKGLDDPQVDKVRGAVSSYARDVGKPFEAKVSGQGTLGPDGANVLFVEHPELQQARDAMVAHPDVPTENDGHPHYVPHVTTHYASTGSPRVESIKFDRLAVWHGDQQDEYPLGDEMPPTKKKPEDIAPEDVPAPDAPVGDTEDMPPDPTKKKKAPAYVSSGNSDGPVPWHAVFAPEGVWSGDKRMFAEGALSNRPLPLPLTWQKVSAEGHDGNVTVAKTERIGKVKNRKTGYYEQRAAGHFIMNPEADEVVGLIGEFGRFGLSVDADDTTYELDEDAEGVVYTLSRSCSACIVPIPAFHQAWIELGDPADDFFDDATDYQSVDDPEALVASAAVAATEMFVDVAPGLTEDGPGWLTHPVDTDRLRDYWVRGEGAAKIGWGASGDFNRCRLNLAKYVKPQYLAGYCANRHFDALGFWPGRPVAGDTETFAADAMELEGTDPAPALTIVASVAHTAPAAWFSDPGFTPDDPRLVQAKDGTWGCPVTVTDEGEVYGHIAKWGVCHIAYSGECVTAPHSQTNYAHFLGGAVHLDDGTVACTGPITVGGGHADEHMSMQMAKAYYDSTSTVAADVAAGDDQFGIWCHGWIRPGTSKDMATALRASVLSGDWRQPSPGSPLQELIVAHAVNAGGFSTPRVRIAAGSQGQISLVAAGAVPQREEHHVKGADLDRLVASLADEVTAELEERQARREAMAALALRVSSGNRVDA